jgi:hypothetical protein
MNDENLKLENLNFYRLYINGINLTSNLDMNNLNELKKILEQRNFLIDF